MTHVALGEIVLTLRDSCTSRLYTAQSTARHRAPGSVARVYHAIRCLARLSAPQEGVSDVKGNTKLKFGATAKFPGDSAQVEASFKAALPSREPEQIKFSRHSQQRGRIAQHLLEGTAVCGRRQA